MRRSFLLLALPLLATPVAAQVALPLRTVALSRDPGRSGVLSAAYRLRLQSEWPQLASATNPGCINGGHEQLSGRLVRTGTGSYDGELERRTTILFCGVHGQVREACRLTLTSAGAVTARGDALVSGAVAWLRLRWAALPDSGVTELSGDCPPEFAGKVQQMYLAVVHGLELPLPGPGEAMRRVMLEDYGWLAEIQREDS